jgi:adenosyl cobinamide kinase/adenosyl cobinamide phosphate guanylyltransferase
MPLLVLLGGARSGKSALAVHWGRAFAGPVTFIATAEAGDDEMAHRIAQHRAERPAGWATVEEPTAVAAAVRAAEPQAMVIVDCLTLWVSNVLERSDDDVLAAAADIAAAAQRRDAPTVVVSNEVGWGIVPADPVTRRYRDLLGEVNALMVARAQRSLLLVAGRAVALESPPPRAVELF